MTIVVDWGVKQQTKNLKVHVSQNFLLLLTDLLNTSLMQCTVPDIWKRANVSPVHKKDDKGSVDNYRPISLLSSVGKTMEKLVHKHVRNYLLEKSIITSFQSGFTAGDSSVYQLVELYNTFLPGPGRRQRGSFRFL